MNLPYISKTKGYDPARIRTEIRNAVLDVIVGLRTSSNVKGRLHKASQLLGLSYRRVERYYYDQVRKIDICEAVQILERTRALKLEQFASRQAEYESLRRELAEGIPDWVARLLPSAVEPLLDPDAQSPDQKDEKDLQ